MNREEVIAEGKRKGVLLIERNPHVRTLMEALDLRIDVDAEFIYQKSNISTMADQNQKPGGALFKNEYKKEDKHPDYKGTIRLDINELQDLINKAPQEDIIIEMDLAAWINVSPKGVKYMSLVAKEKQEPQQQAPAQRGGGTRRPPARPAPRGNSAEPPF